MPRIALSGFWAFALLGAGACSSSTDLMPLTDGMSWQYFVRDPLGARVMKVEVTGKTRVGLNDGWLLDGPGGQSRLSWQGSTLIASELTSVRFDPPIELLRAASERAKWEYKGKCDGRLGTVYITAFLEQKPEKLSLGGVQHEAMKVSLRARIGSVDVMLETWYASRIGILKQEQWSDGTQVASLEWISNG